MSDFIFKTRAEQLLEYLFQQHKHRKLTNDEWEQVRKCEHSIYCRSRRMERSEHEEAA